MDAGPLQGYHHWPEETMTTVFGTVFCIGNISEATVMKAEWGLVVFGALFMVPSLGWSIAKESKISSWTETRGTIVNLAYHLSVRVRAGKGTSPGYPIVEASNAPPLRSSSSNYVTMET